MPQLHGSDDYDDSSRMFTFDSSQMLPYFWQSLLWDNSNKSDVISLETIQTIKT